MINPCAPDRVCGILGSIVYGMDVESLGGRLQTPEGKAAHDRNGGELHRRPHRQAPDRSARVVGGLSRRRCDLRDGHQDQCSRRAGGAHRGARSCQRRSRARDGCPRKGSSARTSRLPRPASPVRTRTARALSAPFLSPSRRTRTSTFRTSPPAWAAPASASSLELRARHDAPLPHGAARCRRLL